MGSRLSKIITRTGDAGETGLGDGSRVAKSAPRIAALGDIDELNASIGLLRCEELPAGINAALAEIQHDLFSLGGELCMPGNSVIDDTQVTRLENWAEEWNADLPYLQEFVLPGGSRPAALAHLCRTQCRRAERSIVALHRHEVVSTSVRGYINRLSDLLFIMSRQINKSSDIPDVLWRR